MALCCVSVCVAADQSECHLSSSAHFTCARQHSESALRRLPPARLVSMAFGVTHARKQVAPSQFTAQAHGCAVNYAGMATALTATIQTG